MRKRRDARALVSPVAGYGPEEHVCPYGVLRPDIDDSANFCGPTWDRYPGRIDIEGS